MSELERNKKLARGFVSAVASIDIDGIQNFFAADVEYNLPNTGCTSGKLDLRRFLKVLTALGKGCPMGLQLDLLDITAEEDRVSLRVDGYARTADGREYNNRYHFLLKIRAGKIFEAYEYYDSLLVEKTFGSLANITSIEAPAV